MIEPTEPPALLHIADAAVSVILLAHNERPHLDEVLQGWVKQLERRQGDYEIILADDCSTDGTADLAQQLVPQHPRLKVLRLPECLGAGAALKAGLAAARHPLLFYTTCDRRYLPVDFQLLLAEIDKVHLVSGYRRWQPVPRGLAAVGRVWRFLFRLLFNITLDPLPGWLGWREHARALGMRILFGLRLRDTSAFFRLFRRAMFERIPVQSRGEFVHDEVLAKANFLGALMTDVLIQYRPRHDRPPESWGNWWRDSRRVLSHPSFGPVHLGHGSQWKTLDVVDPGAV